MFWNAIVLVSGPPVSVDVHTHTYLTWSCGSVEERLVTCDAVTLEIQVFVSEVVRVHTVSQALADTETSAFLRVLCTVRIV